MGLNPDNGSTYILKKIEDDQIEQTIVDLRVLNDSYDEIIINNKLNLGSFCIKAALFGTFFGFLNLEEATEEALPQITQMALEAINS